MHIYAVIYNTAFSHSDLLHSVRQSLGSSSPVLPLSWINTCLPHKTVKFPAGGDHVYFLPSLCAQHPTQTLANDTPSVNLCWMTRHTAERVNMWQQLHFHFWKKGQRSSGAMSAQKVGETGQKRGRSCPPGRSRPVPTSRQLFLHPQSEVNLQGLLEKGMATHSSILAWRTPWTEEPGGLQSMELQRVRHD